MEPLAAYLLSTEEARVVGCLVEKQRTVPDTYPLTLNALLSACNQSTNRDPLVDYDEGTVTRAIDSLKAKGMARIVHPGAGSRSTKYRQVLGEVLAIEDGPLSVLAVLLLRGPQTVAELRTRTERLHTFEEPEALEAALTVLASREEPLVERLERRPGEREPRWRQLLADEPDLPEPSRHADDAWRGVSVTSSDLEARVDQLEVEVADLKSVVDRLRDLL